MSLPHGLHARSFYQASRQRLEDANFLLREDRTTGAVYLAGYSVECMLKALILSMVPETKQEDIAGSFRGAIAHSYDWLKAKYLEKGGPSLPAAISKNFALVNSWTTELRYKPGTIKQGDAETFLRAADEIAKWADGRI